MEQAPWELRRASRSFGTPQGRPGTAAATAALFASRLLCRACGQPVTSETEAIAIEGQPVHRRTNPAGVEFAFGCFQNAPGALPVGEPTAQYSWFPGYAWSYALCLGCGEHLGWYFQGGGPGFYGLILKRLAPEPPGPTEPGRVH